MNVVEAQQRRYKVVEEWVKKNSERQRQIASRGQLTNFAVGDYVMVARVRRPGSTPKLYLMREIVRGSRLRLYGTAPRSLSSWSCES